MGSQSHPPRLLSPTAMGDMEKAVCMTDHFDKIQKLPDPIPGVPNFRRVPGFKVYCTGQPTLEGFEKALEKVCGNIYPKDGPIIWFNLRQEPTVYVNGVGAKNNADEIMDDAAQAFLKSKIMDNIHKYFYLIVFAGYMREASAAAREAIAADKKGSVALPSSGKCSIPAKELTIGKSFVDFMGESSSLRAMVDTGKGNLQWERDIPPAALSNLENLAKTDFKGNLGLIIHDIYQTAHQMFSDMPQGDHKKRAKYRFASKTLMRILPDAQRGEVEGLIEKGKMTLDLYEILGVCTWIEPK